MIEIATLVAKASQILDALSVTKPRKYFPLSFSTESIAVLEDISRSGVTGEQNAALVPPLKALQLGWFLLLFPLLATLPG